MGSTFAGYGVYVFRGFGYKGFISKPVLPLVAFYGIFKGAQVGMNYFREQLFEPERRS